MLVMVVGMAFVIAFIHQLTLVYGEVSSVSLQVETTS